MTNNLPQPEEICEGLFRGLYPVYNPDPAAVASALADFHAHTDDPLGKSVSLGPTTRLLCDFLREKGLGREFYRYLNKRYMRHPDDNMFPDEILKKYDLKPLRP